jgi:thiol-disulfide isomerase/thioredoxin
MQKELIHFTQPDSEVCAAMEPIINKLVKENPDIKYVRIDVSKETELFEYYNSKYPINYCPAFIGIVDGKVQDGHIGQATQLILESLVG